MEEAGDEDLVRLEVERGRPQSQLAAVGDFRRGSLTGDVPTVWQAVLHLC